MICRRTLAGFLSLLSVFCLVVLALKKQRALAISLSSSGGRMLRSGSAGDPRDGEVLYMVFNSLLVFLSVMVAVVGAFTTLTTSSYVRLVRSSCWYVMMVVQCGLGLGVSTVWCMHFAGMRSFVLWRSNVDEELNTPVGFELGLTLLSAGVCWLFAGLAIHVSIGQTVVFESHYTRMPAATVLLSIGVGSMHYLGLLAEQGQFVCVFDGWLVLLSVLVCLVCCSTILVVIANLPNKTLWRCAGSCLVATLASVVHYFGMLPVSHTVRHESIKTLLGAEPLDVTAEATVIVALFCDVLLMTGNAFYLEVIKDRDKKAMAEELEYQQYVGDAGKLIKASRVMQFPLALVRAQEFKKLGRLTPHERLRDKNLLIMLDTPRAAAKLRRKGCIVFFSHQWLSSQLPDPDEHQYTAMVRAIEDMVRVRSLSISNIFIWVDYCSIPQCSAEQQQLAINSLPAYVAACSAFIIVAPEVMHAEQKTICNFASYSNRFWCRVEVFCAVLTAMSHHRADTNASFLVSRSMARTVSVDMVPTDSDEGFRQRVYLTSGGVLQPLPFMDEDGMQTQFVDLLDVYSGELGCCVRQHQTATGEHVLCDKSRVVQALTGLYGSMLVQLLRLRMQKPRERHLLRLQRLGEKLMNARHVYFPPQYFGSRIEAMHEYLQNVSNSRQSSEDDSSLGSPTSTQNSIDVEKLIADLDEHGDDGSSDNSAADADDECELSISAADADDECEHSEVAEERV
ncbi:unnamed protein product [Symbiodinium sp. KB8]|nr:unnamed protein product [Symbiodinium sp. KB8]